MKLVRYLLWAIMAAALFVAFGAMDSHNQVLTVVAIGAAFAVLAIQVFWAARDIMAILAKR